MKYVARRGLMKLGHSYVVVIPRPFMMKMCLYRRIPLELVYDDETDVITITRAESKPAGISANSNTHGVQSLF